MSLVRTSEYSETGQLPPRWTVHVVHTVAVTCNLTVNFVLCLAVEQTIGVVCRGQSKLGNEINLHIRPACPIVTNTLHRVCCCHTAPPPPLPTVCSTPDNTTNPSEHLFDPPTVSYFHLPQTYTPFSSHHSRQLCVLGY